MFAVGISVQLKAGGLDNRPLCSFERMGENRKGPGLVAQVVRALH
jgi:hypothetical protein